jgi:hypothetical protein
VLFPLRQFHLLTSSHLAKDLTFGINEFAPLWGKELVFSHYGRFSLPVKDVLLRTLSVGVGVGLLARRPRWPIPVWILSAAFTALYLTAVKNWSYFAMALIPYAAGGWSQTTFPWRKQGAAVGRAIILVLCALLLILMKLGWWSQVTSGLGTGLSYNPTHHSVGAAEIIRRAGPTVRMMNPHDLGGWLAWATGRQVYIDGRNDNYPEHLYREFIGAGNAEHFKALLEVIRANVVVARDSREGIWIEAMAKEPDWRLVLHSDGLTVFMRNDLAPEIPALGQEERQEKKQSDFSAWDRQLQVQAAKPPPDWWSELPFGQLSLDGVAGQSAGSIFLGRAEEAKAFAWEGICKSRYFIVELWVNLAVALEMSKEYPQADFCWDTILRKVPDKDLQERAEKARSRRNKPDPSPYLEEMRRKGLR